MTLGFNTFNLNKSEFREKLSRIIKNFRTNSKLVGEPREFILRCCRLTEKWSKLANDSDVEVYLRNVDTAGGRKVKMISLERGTTKQPVPKAKLTDSLYPAKKISTTATPEEKHMNSVKSAMRFAVGYQLKAYRDSCQLPVICSISGRKILPASKSDVDHLGEPFAQIADSFIESRGLNYTDIALVGPPTAKRFKDTKLWEEWIYYHLQRARFSLTLASANRSKGAGGYCTNVSLIGSFAATDEETISLDF